MTGRPDAAVLDPPRPPERGSPAAEPPVASTPTPGPGGALLAPGQRRRLRRWLTMAALAMVTAFGACLRAHGLSDLGLWRDDAWVALSAHVGIGEAWRMLFTAPGSDLIDRTVLALSPGTTPWAQVPALVAGVATIPAAYALARCFRFGRPAALVVAVAIATAPLCVEYSTRVKEYELDVLLSCAVLAAGEVARRTCGRRQLAVLAVVSVVSFFCSASLAAVVGGVFVALAVSTRRGRRFAWPRPVVAASAATFGACAAIGLAFYTGLSPAENQFWAREGAFVTHHSLGSILSSLGWVLWHLGEYAVGLGALTEPARVLLVAVWLVLVALALSRDRSMLAPFLVVVVAVLASAAQVEPLGTGRTDQYLYPALLLLTVGGLRRVYAAVARDVARRPRREVLAVAAVGLSLGGLALGLWAVQAWSERPVYPGVDVPALVAQIHHHEQPGDHVFVSELVRFPWAWAEEPRSDIRFGRAWTNGFTVVSTDPDVFIVPSEYFEGESHPKAWAAAMDRYHRLWYVWSPPLSDAPSYRALLADGWRPRTVLRAPGGSATLMIRG